MWEYGHGRNLKSEAALWYAVPRMERLYFYSLVPVVAVAFLLFSSSVLHGKNARGLAAYCLAVGGWAGVMMLSSAPATAWIGHRLLAAGGFVVAGFLHAAYSMVGPDRRTWLWAAYAVAAMLACVHFVYPGWIHDPVALRAGPLFWPSMGAALAAAVVPAIWLWRKAPKDPATRHDLRRLFFAGALGYAGAAAHAVLLAHGLLLPYGMLVVLASLLVVANVVRSRQPVRSRRLLDRSLSYSSLAAVLSAGFLFGVLTLLEDHGGAFVAEYRLGAFFLLAMAAVAFEPLRRHVMDLFGARVLGRPRASDLVDALAREEQRADQASRLAEIGTLTSAVAHEVRGPLGVMSAQLKLLERTGADSETTASMREQLRRTERFVEDMLCYGRPRPLELRRVDLAALVDLGISTARTAQGDASVAVRIERVGLSETVWGEGDQGQLLQVIVIVVDNALLALAGRDDAVLRVTVSATDKGTRLTFEDDGPGIPASILPRLFEPFVTGRKREGPRPGTGLGLAIARGIVERHGGAITAGRSELGGALFTIELLREVPVAS